VDSAAVMRQQAQGLPWFFPGLTVGQSTQGKTLNNSSMTPGSTSERDCRDLGLPAGVPRLLQILPTELRRKRLHADYLILVEIDGSVFTLHLEFQNRPDSDIGSRVLQYQAAVIGKYHGPVYSVVFNVHGEGSEPHRRGNPTAALASRTALGAARPQTTHWRAHQTDWP
jgi:hypothetical protein